VVASLGFEPRQADSESAVLPLHHEAVKGGKTKGAAAVGKVKKNNQPPLERGSPLRYGDPLTARRSTRR
jgi:hypothetical protein